MSTTVEGNWKKFVFKMIDKSYFPSVQEHLHANFYLDEPLLEKVGLSRVGADEFDAVVEEILGENLSFAAIDSHNGKVAGLRITMRHGKSYSLDDIASTIKSPQLRSVVQFVIALDKQCDIFEEHAIEEYADFMIASVARDYRGQGLATEMYKRALNFLKETGFVCAKSAFTSPITRRTAAKLGFKELARKYFRDVKNQNGDFLCPDAGDDEFAAIMTINLSSITKL